LLAPCRSRVCLSIALQPRHEGRAVRCFGRFGDAVFEDAFDGAPREQGDAPQQLAVFAPWADAGWKSTTVSLR
jgi:hypothetical protein